jgi:hypothetical protein
MTGTVTGATAYQRYAGGQWRVMSPNCSTMSSPYQCATGSRGSGSRLSGRCQQFRCRTLGHETSSRGWLLSERSRR